MTKEIALAIVFIAWFVRNLIVALDDMRYCYEFMEYVGTFIKSVFVSVYLPAIVCGIIYIMFF